MGMVTVQIEYENDEGEVLGPSYQVELEYARIVEPNYGADADGNRGMRLVEIEVTWVDPDPRIPEWAKREAVKRFEDNPGRYS